MRSEAKVHMVTDSLETNETRNDIDATRGTSHTLVLTSNIPTKQGEDKYILS